MLDSNLPAVIAYLLTNRLETGETGLKELSITLGKDNPLKFETDNPTVFTNINKASIDFCGIGYDACKSLEWSI